MKSNGLAVELPGHFAESVQTTAAEFKHQVRVMAALKMFELGKLSSGKAAELAGMSRLDFNDVLAGRGIPMHYGQKELEEDLAYARSCQ